MVRSTCRLELTLITFLLIVTGYARSRARSSQAISTSLSWRCLSCSIIAATCSCAQNGSYILFHSPQDPTNRRFHPLQLRRPYLRQHPPHHVPQLREAPHSLPKPENHRHAPGRNRQHRGWETALESSRLGTAAWPHASPALRDEGRGGSVAGAADVLSAHALGVWVGGERGKVGGLGDVYVSVWLVAGSVILCFWGSC
jgi:hypothetical protein